MTAGAQCFSPLFLSSKSGVANFGLEGQWSVRLIGWPAVTWFGAANKPPGVLFPILSWEGLWLLKKKKGERTLSLQIITFHTLDRRRNPLEKDKKKEMFQA